MAPDVLPRFFAHLQATGRVYARLLEVAEQKQKHILQNDIEQLREDLRQEEQLANEGATLDAQRDTLHARCRAQLNVTEGGATLHDLCAHMPAPWKERFQAERQALRETLERLHEANRLNVALVNNSLDLMKGLLSALFDAEPTAAYERNGLRTGMDVSGRALNASA